MLELECWSSNAGARILDCLGGASCLSSAHQSALRAPLRQQVHRNVARMHESFGRYMPPDTVRTVEEDVVDDSSSFIKVNTSTGRPNGLALSPRP